MGIAVKKCGDPRSNEPRLPTLSFLSPWQPYFPKAGKQKNIKRCGFERKENWSMHSHMRHTELVGSVKSQTSWCFGKFVCFYHQPADKVKLTFTYARKSAHILQASQIHFGTFGKMCVDMDESAEGQRGAALLHHTGADWSSAEPENEKTDLININVLTPNILCFVLLIKIYSFQLSFSWSFFHTSQTTSQTVWITTKMSNYAYEYIHCQEDGILSNIFIYFFLYFISNQLKSMLGGTFTANTVSWSKSYLILNTTCIKKKKSADNMSQNTLPKNKS